jgi:hypothetical protein
MADVQDRKVGQKVTKRTLRWSVFIRFDEILESRQQRYDIAQMSCSPNPQNDFCCSENIENDTVLKTLFHHQSPSTSPRIHLDNNSLLKTFDTLRINTSGLGTRPILSLTIQLSGSSSPSTSLLSSLTQGNPCPSPTSLRKAS